MPGNINRNWRTAVHRHRIVAAGSFFHTNAAGNYGDGDSVSNTETMDEHFTRDLRTFTEPCGTLTIVRQGNDLVITWSESSARLQASTDFNQWVELTGVTSPASLSSALPYRCFRLICP